MRYRDLLEVAHPFRQVVARLTTATTGGNVALDVLRQQTGKWLQSLRNLAFRNAETEHDIVVVAASIRKTTRVGSILLRLHYALPQILERGIFLSSEPPRADRPNMVEMLNLGASVTLDDKLYHVVAKIRRYPQANQHYSLHFDGELMLVDTPPDFNPAGGS